MAAARFGVKVHIAPGANPAADASTWVWVDVSTKVRYPGQDGGQPITITAGRQDEGSRIDAASMNLTFDNRQGNFSTHNPLGTWYGALRRNTPIRVGQVLAEDTFTRTVSNGWGTTDDGRTWAATYNPTVLAVGGTVATVTFPVANVSEDMLLADTEAADVDAAFTCSSPVVATGAGLIFAGYARYIDTNNFYYFACDLNVSGTIVARIVSKVAGSAVFLTSITLPITYVANERIRVRYQVDGISLRMKIWKEAATEPVTWSATATHAALAAGKVGLLAWRVVGNTNPGSVALAFDNYTAQSVEFTGTVTVWPVRWDKTSRNCWAPIQAAGILRRLQQGSGTLLSALTRQLPVYGPTGYWSLEDGADATTFANLVTGGRPAIGVKVSPAVDSSLPGATVSPALTDAAGRISGVAPRVVGGTGFSAMFFTKLSALPAARTVLATFTGSGRVIRWVISIEATNVYVEGYDSGSTLVVNAANSFSVVLTEWIAWQLETEVVGANTNWALAFHQVGATLYLASSGSFASTIVSTVTAWVLGGGTELNGCAFAHVWLGPNTLPFVTNSFSLVSAGYAGEAASTRIARLCLEEGIPVAVEAGTSELLGPQRQSNILDALQAAADADFGILYERGSGLGYRPRSARYEQPVLLALSVAAKHIDEAPEPINDDQRIRNDWTVSRDGGSSARVYDQDHIDAEGRYPDSTTINVVDDDVLIHHAGWRVFLGTQPELRWPAITLKFTRAPALLPAWRSKGYGPRMTVTTGLAQVAGSDPDVIVEGWTQTITPDSWTATLNCSPARLWDSPALDDPDLRLDTDGCELAEDLDTTETAVDVLTTSGPVWAPTSILPGEVPFPIIVGGEVMTVTNVSGTGTSQTLTVTRSVNGIVKTHTTGAPVALARPAYLAL